MRECVVYTTVQYGMAKMQQGLYSAVVSLLRLRTYFWQLLQANSMVWQQDSPLQTKINDTQLCRSCTKNFKVIIVLTIYLYSSNTYYALYLYEQSSI